MKVAYCSDLHLEFRYDYPELYTDADVLVLAGDIIEARHVENHLSFFKELCAFYKHVIYIAGNHEYYRSELKKTIRALSEINISNLHFLYNRSVIIEGKVFAGTTLWTDIPPHQQWFAQHGMNDYRLIKIETDTGYRKLRPYDTVLEHCISREWIKTLDKVDVMITHHAPSYRSIEDRYIGNEYNCCYATDLGELLTKAKFWIHGHMHNNHDYVIYGCNVLCNPLGYPTEIKEPFQLKVFEI